MVKHEMPHIETGETQDAILVMNRLRIEKNHFTKMQENYIAYTALDGTIYVCDPAAPKEVPKNAPPKTEPGQRNSEHARHSYDPIGLSRKNPDEIGPIDSSCSHHDNPGKHDAGVLVLHTPDLFT